MTLWPHRGFVLEISDGTLGKVLRSIPKFHVAGGGKNNWEPQAGH